MVWKIAATTASGVPMPSSTRDQAEVADGRIGQQALQVMLEDRDEGAEQQGATPAPAMIQVHSGVPDSAGHRRISRNTPAFTMVAECR